MDEIIICRNIKKLRKQNHFTLEKLAGLTGLTKRGICTRWNGLKKPHPILR